MKIEAQTIVDNKPLTICPNTNDIKKDFKNILEGEIHKRQPVAFSKHANQRINTRNIHLTTEQMKRVENGIHMAKEKGIQDTLVLVDSVALVVNTKNNVIVTAMEKENQNVFTNIDGAVIV